MHGPNWYMRAFGCIFLCDRKHFKLFTSEFQFNAYILLNHLFNAIRWIMQCKSRNIEVFTRTTHTHTIQEWHGQLLYAQSALLNRLFGYTSTGTPSASDYTSIYIELDEEKKNIEIIGAGAAAAASADAVT